MRSASIPFSLTKHCNHVFVKLAASFLLIGLAFRLLISDSTKFTSLDSPVLPAVDTHDEPKPDSTTLPIQEPVFSDVSANESSVYMHNDAEKCDLFAGDWMPNPSGPIYTNESCHIIPEHQNCMKNGRPDSGYLFWRWSSRNCDLPGFNPAKFLRLMRNKSWGFIGDSISRNHVQSLVCILSKVEEAVELYHDAEYKSVRWHFPSHNLIISVIFAPFLLKAAILEDINGVSSKEVQVHLDQLEEKWTNQYPNFDYVVIAGGYWFLKSAIYHENNAIVGCHYCPGKNLTEMGLDQVYRRALQLVFNFITLSDHKAFVFFRTLTPSHFENAEWNNGGYCNRTVPFKEGEIEISDGDKLFHDIEMEEYERAAESASENGITLKLLDFTRLSLVRPDGHPGPYRHFYPFAKDKNAKVQNDCLHWCLPGPIDSWNDIVMGMIVNGGLSR